ncbi:MAG TPA: antibiotic biosynthesis monooxygenase family protein [bacterium]|nr:antibiotic biosynthesis monooxygenase family protein [bacterium]
MNPAEGNGHPGTDEAHASRSDGTDGVDAAATELFVFVRLHAREGREAAIEGALREVLGPSRDEPGCLAIQAFRATQDLRLFYIHSRWVNEAAFDHHAALAHTVHFIQRVAVLIDHTLVVTRATPID